MSTDVSTTEENSTEAVSWPYHVNPETGRANKCYKVNNCRFGIPADQHYATAAEALTHAPNTDTNVNNDTNANNDADKSGSEKPARRKRATKAEMEARRAAEASASSGASTKNASDSADEKPRRKRATKAEMEARRAAEASASSNASTTVDEPAEKASAKDDDKASAKPTRKSRKPRAAKASTPTPAVIDDGDNVPSDDAFSELADDDSEDAGSIIAEAAEVASAEVIATEAPASLPAAAGEGLGEGVLDGDNRIAAQRHDDQINELYQEREEQQALLTGNLRTLAHRLGINLKKRIDPDKVIARAEAAEAPERIKKYLDWAKGNLTAVQAAQHKIEELDADYSGWDRYFIVPGGHIHTSTQCRTCNHSWEHPTQFEWLTDFSGSPLDEVVDQHGAVLCTVCFPEAPIEWTNYFDRLAEEKKKTQCSGSATWDYDIDTARLGQPTGNYGVCEHCGKQISITSTGKLRAHRSPAVVDAAEAMTADAAKATV